MRAEFWRSHVGMPDRQTRFHRAAKSLSWLFVAAGLIALGYWTSVQVRAYLFQLRAPEFPHPAGRIARPPESVASRSTTEDPEEGTAIARLDIPRIGLSTVVVEGVGNTDLKFGAGHVPGTALPGEPGNVGIAGHRDTVFRPLRLIQPNDSIEVATPRGTDTYRVVSTKIVSPDDVAALYPTPTDSLTLITCYPFHYIGAAPRRFIVRAELEPR
jgi:sortase A